jgi:hypothetical protein
MKSNLLSTFWRRTGIFVASAALGLSAWGVSAVPAVADEYHNTIARTILNLQQSKEFGWKSI